MELEKNKVFKIILFMLYTIKWMVKCMKKIFYLILVCLTVIVTAGCGKVEVHNNTSNKKGED